MQAYENLQKRVKTSDDPFQHVINDTQSDFVGIQK